MKTKKHSFIFIYLLMQGVFLLAFLQANGQSLQPTATEALLTFYAATPQNKPLQEEVKFVSAKNRKEFKGKTDASGKLEILLPINDTYEVHFAKAPRIDDIPVKNAPNYKLSKKVLYNGSDSGLLSATLSHALVRFSYHDLEGKPLENETITLAANKSGEKYTAATKSGGQPAELLVPLGDTYSLSVKYDSNYRQMTVKSQTGLYNLNIKYSSIGSKAWEARLADRAKKLAEREALWEKSLWDFPKTDSVVSSAFRRQGELKNRLVVVDVTGSMNPYLDQVIYWYKLNFSQNGANHFVLFNDGDATPDHKKIIGKTGGIYICKSCDMQNLGITARKARAGGNGGDGPENNIEALLKGIEGISGFEEIIMIADNFADVKDISLLPALVAKKKPIKIILCGVQNEINEDYLNIAYHTKGSLHLIQQDLFDLSKTTEGNRVKIGDDHYLLHNGKFFLDNKK